MAGLSPNRGSLDVGRVQELEIPEFARGSFSAAPLNPLNMYASSRLMMYGAAGVTGKRVWPWQRRRKAEAANRIAQGRATVYSPMDVGYSQ